VTITIPTDAAELEEILLDDKRLKAVAAEEGKLGEFIKAYQTASASKDTTIHAQAREEAQRVLVEFLKDQRENGAQTPANLTIDQVKAMTQTRNSIYNPKAPGAALDAEFDGAAEFFRAAWHRASALPDAQALSAKIDAVRKIQNSFGSTVPGDGGFLIPETLRSELLSVALETAIVRSRARTIPMESLRVPIPSVDSTSNASSVFGGVTAYWTEEAAALTETQASFGRVVLDAKKLTAYSEVPNELIADAPAFGAFFSQLFPEALAWYEDVAFISGSGVGEPLGFIACPAMVQVAKETGQAAATILWENIVKMYARMLPASLGRAVWIASIDTFPELATMALSVGTGGSAIWLNNGQAGPPMTILGRPVIFTEKTSVLGTAGDINFVDLGYYLIGDRQAMQASSSEHYKFQNDKTVYRIIERLDGRPWLQSSITPKNGAGNLSPFVQIATR